MTLKVMAFLSWGVFFIHEILTLFYSSYRISKLCRCISEFIGVLEYGKLNEKITYINNLNIPNNKII